MPSKPEDVRPDADAYEPPEVEEIDAEGPIATAPQASQYSSITLIDDDEEQAEDTPRDTAG